MATGITTRHHRRCPSHAGGKCGKPCVPTYQAWVFSRRDGKKIYETFPTPAAARSWRTDALSGVNKGTLRAPTAITLREVADTWLEGAEAGNIRTRSGDAYKPSAIRSYRAALDNRILDELGAHKLSEIRRVDLQDFVDRLAGKGLDASTIRNQLMPLRAIYRRALSRGEVAVNPTSGLELPAVRGTRDRIASPQEAAKLIAALPKDADKALWATALYAGLRRGELMALRWEDVDTKKGILRVERAWDPVACQFVAPKSRAGRRTVPIPSALKTTLLEHRLRCGRSSGLVFGPDGSTPFKDRWTQISAQKAWKTAKLAPIGLHEARHTFASLMIAAGVNAKALSTYLGHASVTITYDRYGHLMPGNEDEAAALLDNLLTGANRGAQAVVTAQ